MRHIGVFSLAEDELSSTANASLLLLLLPLLLLLDVLLVSAVLVASLDGPSLTAGVITAAGVLRDTGAAVASLGL